MAKHIAAGGVISDLFQETGFFLSEVLLWDGTAAQMFELHIWLRDDCANQSWRLFGFVYGQFYVFFVLPESGKGLEWGMTGSRTTGGTLGVVLQNVAALSVSHHD